MTRVPLPSAVSLESFDDFPDVGQVPPADLQPAFRAVQAHDNLAVLFFQPGDRGERYERVAVDPQKAVAKSSLKKNIISLRN